MDEERPTRLAAEDIGYLIGRGKYVGPEAGILFYRPSNAKELIPREDMETENLRECLGFPVTIAIITSTKDVISMRIGEKSISGNEIDAYYSRHETLWGRGSVEIELCAEYSDHDSINNIGRLRLVGFRDI